jgi:hypothetical protein
MMNNISYQFPYPPIKELLFFPGQEKPFDRCKCLCANFVAQAQSVPAVFLGFVIQFSLKMYSN